MDVEKIQRINNLAVELQKQGLATSREDAVEQAKNIFNIQDKSAIDPNQMQSGSLQVRNEITTPGQPSSSPSSSNSGMDLSQEKVSEILKKNSNFLVTTIKNFQAKIDKLEHELASIKSRIHTISSRPAAHSPAPSQPAPAQPAAPVQSTTTNPQGGDHPRSGGYNANDVSIEKFFYMGSR